MRVRLFSTAVAIGLGLAGSCNMMAQAHGGGAAGHSGGSGHAASPRGPMSTGSLGSRPGHAVVRPSGMNHPLNRPNTYNRSGTAPGHGPAPGPNGSSGRERNRHVGYGYGAVGYSFLPYAGGYWDGSISDINYDPNDPNTETTGAQPDNDADTNPSQVPYVGMESNDYPPQPRAYDNARMPYSPNSIASSGGGSASDGLKHPKVILIFKDGRAPVHIQNYAMSQTKVFIRDSGDERDIAVSDLDIAATTVANHQAGVDFELPVQR